MNQADERALHQWTFRRLLSEGADLTEATVGAYRMMRDPNKRTLAEQARQSAEADQAHAAGAVDPTDPGAIRTLSDRLQRGGMSLEQATITAFRHVKLADQERRAAMLRDAAARKGAA